MAEGAQCACDPHTLRGGDGLHSLHIDCGGDGGGGGRGGGGGGGCAGPPEQLAETCQRKIILLEKHDILINHSRTSNNV